ncbi:uncharacterized protein TM_0508-like [Ptychodera flava]|uniref:uncharacterized protein TM_0508-like n=1 Tax=Ptychodera flava TaxID=63121 RepID=UPI00396A2256
MAEMFVEDGGFSLTLCEYKASKDTSVSVRCGDITLEKVDAISSSANAELIHEDGIAKAIVKAGGDSIQTESDNIVQERGPLDVTEVVYTSAGKLECQHVLHVVCPIWRVDSVSDVTDRLFECCLNLLNTASKDTRSTSIAIPAVGTGICGIPADVCAKTMYKAVNEFIANKSSADSLCDIRVIGLDWDTMEIFQKVFEEKGSSGNQDTAIYAEIDDDDDDSSDG